MHRVSVIEFLEPRRLLTVTPTFAAPVGYLTGKGPIAVETGDFDGDHNLDFITADSVSGTVTIRRGRGDGTFRPATTINVGSDPTSIAVGDFDGNGTLDFAVAVAGASQVKVYLGSGDGATFTLTSTLAGGNFAVESGRDYGTGAKLVTGDFDGDGKLDLAVTNPAAHQFGVFLGQGNGQFAPAVFTTSVADAIAGITAADFNGDGKTDIAVSGESTVQIFFAAGSGAFSSSQIFGYNGNGGTNTNIDLSDAHDIVAADLNGDGVLDLAEVSGDLDGGDVLIGSASGQFTYDSSNGFSSRGNDGNTYDDGSDRGPNALVAADLNGDHAIDLAITNLSDSTRAYAINDGSADWITTETPTVFDTFGNVPPSQVPVDAIAAGDFNNDGKIDLLMAGGPLSRNVYLLTNTTTGQAVSPPSVDSFSGTYNASAKSITFAATASETNGSISSVDFYDANSDALLGTGSFAAGQWTLTIDASSYSPDTYSFYAVANDANTYSQYGTASVTVPNVSSSPTINSFTVSPTTITTAGQSTLTFKATASESSGTISSVKFYYETNNTAGVQGADTLAATGALVNGVWIASASNAFTTTGTFTIDALATDANGNTAYATATYTVVTAPTLAINNVTANEGNSGTTAFVFTVTRSGNTSVASTVAYATQDGTAAAGDDYAATSGTLSFAAGVTSKTITVLVNGDTTLEPNETFSVVLSNATNATISTATGTGTITNDDSPQPAPAAPSGLAGTAKSATQIVLTWKDNASNEAGFEIDRSTSSDFSNAVVFNPAANVQTYTDNTVVASTTYYYRIRAFNNGGSTVSGYSNASPIKTPSSSTAPSAPTSIAGVANSATQITVTWKDTSSNETGFEIQRSASSSFSSATTFTVGPNVTSYSDNTLTKSTYYYYRVRAVNGSLGSAYTSSLKIKTLASGSSGGTTGTGLAAPTGLAGTAVAGPAVSLTWKDNASGETGYEIQVSTASNFTPVFSDITVNTPNLAAYKVTGLTKSSYYYFRVRAISSTASLDSAWSSSVKIKTLTT